MLLSRSWKGLTVAMALLFAGGAHAELNLWISHHFAGLDQYETGDYQDARIVLEAALDETGKRHRRGDTHNKLGQVYTALGEFEQAEDHYQQALSLKRRDLGKRHRDIPNILNNLADLYYLMEKPEKVESLYRESLDILERDQLNLEVCRALNGLALLYNDGGEYVKAEETLKRAIRVHEKAQRRDHPYMATVLTNLGILYTNLERYDEAEPLFERSAYVQDVELRPGHPDAAVRLHATAVLYHNTGRGAEAATLAAHAEKIRDAQRAKGDLY
jgi:tetratricopeptide (TPR) repeat protein